MASIGVASNTYHRPADELLADDANASYFIDTNSFSAQDFDLFVHSLEETYHAQLRAQQPDHTVEPAAICSEDERDRYSLCESLARYAQPDQISSYGGTPTSSSCCYPSSSEESLLSADAPHNRRIGRDDPAPLVTRKSFLNIFQYFDQDVTLAEEDGELPAVKNDCPALDGEADEAKRRERSKKKSVLREWDTNVEQQPGRRPPKQPVGRLNAQLLQMFEGENEHQRSIHLSAPCNNNNNNLSQSVRSAGAKKVPIMMQHNPIGPAEKSVNGGGKRHGTKPADPGSAGGPRCGHQSQPAADGRRVMNRQPTTVPTTVKIVNAAPKVQHATVKQSDRHNLNERPAPGAAVSSDRDKCYVRNINELFLQYRSRERSEHGGALPNFSEHVREAIEQIEKIEERHVRSVLGQHAFDEPAPTVKEEASSTTPPERPQVHGAEHPRAAVNNIEPPVPAGGMVAGPAQASALDLHYRLRHETYRLQMHNLIETEQFVRMGAADRDRLYLLDTIFNRSHLSLIHTVLALIQANIGRGDQVLLETRMVGPAAGSPDGADAFCAAIGTGRYRIDALATSAAGENCVELEVIAVDEATGRMLKITVEFVIDVADGQSNGRPRPAPDTADEFRFVVRMVFEVKGRARDRSFYTVDCGMYWDRDRVLPFLRKCASTVRRTVARALGPPARRLKCAPPENELQKSHETGTNLSEHQLRVQASLQRLNIPDWYKQYSGKDGPGSATPAGPITAAGTAGASTGTGGGILRKRNSDVGRWTGLSSKTTSLSSLGSHRSDRSPVMLSPSAHSHHGQTGFSRWSTSHLNSNQTSPSVSTRGSFTRGGLNASVISGYSTASAATGANHGNGSSTIRNSFRQPYLGWRSQEKLSQPRTPAERCWLESSFVGTRPLDSPQTPLIENSSVLGSGQQQQQQHQHQQQQQPHTAGDHYRFNAGRMNGVGGAGAAVPTFSLPAEHQSPGSATLEDVLASLLGLPADSHRSSAASVANACLTPTAPNSSNHTLQIEPMQTRRRSEGDAAGTRKRNDSGGSMAISSTATTTTTTSGSTNQSGRHNHHHQQQQQGQQQPASKGDLLGAGLDARIARRVSLDSAEAAGHGHYLKCRYPRCDATATLAEARKTFKSCHNCSHLYCSRECRRAHWERHRKACLHSRVSALCRLVLSTCKDDADTLRHLSVLARRGYLSQGRGVVRILFRSPERADSFIKQGFQCLGEVSYVRWPDLLPAEMGPELYSELLKLSTEYKPDSKMLLYVAICVVSEAPGSATAPVKWERQLVSRCAKLKLCRTVVSEIASGPGAGERPGPRPDTVGDVLVLSFNILSKTTQRAREQVSLNVQTVLRQRGVNLRKHYPEVYQRLATFVEGSTDRFLPVTLHPRDTATGRSFVCIVMPNYGDTERVQFPVSENGDDRVVTVDVGADLGDDLTSKL
uniref:MYND-type domain-containing protein n=1 Tax=Anopheles melas TaxID=34690 RepID=A0A182TKN5_9DIPT